MKTPSRHLSDTLAESFPPWIQERGDALRARGQVEIVGSSADDVEVRVHDESPWTVTLRLRRDGGLYAACDCPAGRRGGGHCRHLWAGLRSSEEAGLLTALALPIALEAPGTTAATARGPSPVPDAAHSRRARRAATWTPPSTATWRDRLRALQQVVTRPTSARANPNPNSELLYVVDGAGSVQSRQLVVELLERGAGSARPSKPRPARVPVTRIPELPHAADREALALLLSAETQVPWNAWHKGLTEGALGPRLLVDDCVAAEILPRLCRTGRCFLRGKESSEPSSLAWDDGPPWQLRLEARATAAGYTLAALLCREDERRDAHDAHVVLPAGLLVFDGHAARLDHGGLFPWLVELREQPRLVVPQAEAADLAVELALAVPNPAHLEVPPELRVETLTPTPRPRLTIRRDAQRARHDRLTCELVCDYDGLLLESGGPTRLRVGTHPPRLVVRDARAEERFESDLEDAGVRSSPNRAAPGGVRREIAPRRVPGAVRRLLASGWYVEAEGDVYRRARSLSMRVESGVDWFDLVGEADFDGRRVPLPALLLALRRGEGMVALGDGEFGLLPEEWLKRFGLAARVGEHGERTTRFRASQVTLLAALLEGVPDAAVDAAFEQARARLISFEGVTACPTPAGFQGELRAYQREGLGFLRFLDEFGFGGCLADDMGLGKTVQVLALLVQRRAEAPGEPPALVVAPRSLIFNWQSEAARFAPHLSLCDHTGLERARQGSGFEGYDVVLTTYGTLRRDAALLREVAFDYVILDEAQAIKNANSETAKAARLLRGRRRLALSGTPIENHLGELFSLLEFLNPGMLGRLGAPAARAGSDLDDDERRQLARSLRPFILRRTKDQVARDLPAKTEQTLVCALDPAQRRLYDEVRDHYRATLLKDDGREALTGSKLHVLEALLRLRQAACHPGLLDPARAGDPSAKLDALLARLAEVVDEGHKALVFSQFTRFLALVRQRLAGLELAYEYLDGATRDRAARVARFQNDPECRVFLVSLKAGGLGLNLTAAEYVFLLDPWWNPAVEAQAIDRSHRIGQARPVFAYRLIAQDTVEEKILELQTRKRHLAEAVIAADEGPLGALKREDLELLLS
jgi:superfamily II DNA or RNA helicase